MKPKEAFRRREFLKKAVQAATVGGLNRRGSCLAGVFRGQAIRAFPLYLLAGGIVQAENVTMRKTTIVEPAIESGSREEWLDLDPISAVEVISEDPNFPIESALAANGRGGWRAAEKGVQIVRIVFDRPTPLHL